MTLSAAIRLVNFRSQDGLRLDGLLGTQSNPSAIVVHVHGKCGNFYQNDFIRFMLELLPARGIAFLAFNNRGHDCLAEGYFRDRMQYLGGSVEVFEECLLDLDGALQFATTVSPHIVLQGHSNGCEKALYALKTLWQRTAGAVLLSPSDSHALQVSYLAGSSLEELCDRLRGECELHPDRLVEPSSYGIRVKGIEYTIPVTARSLLGLLEGPALSVLRYEGSTTTRSAPALPIPCLVCLGGKDPYQTVSADTAFSVLSGSFSKASLFRLEDANHHFHGHEAALCEAVAQWVHNHAL